MYGWLAGALENGGEVVTANRRLARELTEEFDRQQIDKGRLAWPAPPIRAWQDWLSDQLAAAAGPEELPQRINSHQSRILWERCLRREISDPLLNIAMLVRQSRDAWKRLREFGVDIESCAETALGRDQRIFARAALSYESILAREGWIDEADIPDRVRILIGERRIVPPGAITLAGFDRLVPQVRAVLDAARSAGSRITEAPIPAIPPNGELWSYENADAELRAAGRWARLALEDVPGQRVGIVVTGLETDAARSVRLVREGFAPGWQFGSVAYQSAVNVSYGRSLAEFPMVCVALLLLRWLHTELSSGEISLLLRSDALAGSAIANRCKLELGLRELPDRRWSPAMLLGVASGSRWERGAADWLKRVEALAAARHSLPRRQAPSGWAESLDKILQLFEWPGQEVLDSTAFQVVNRWRELLNDFARLGVVVDNLSVAEALSRLGTMAGETLFQPESETALVHLLGPLEAAGMEFDKLWIAGASSNAWPPPARPLALVSRHLQRQHAMPDATPADTLQYAQRVLTRLAASASEYVCSYALRDGDAEQTASGLLANLGEPRHDGPSDPDWNARQLVGEQRPCVARTDAVPRVTADERVYGGSSSLQWQLSEPFSGFVYSRLAVRTIPSMQSGLSHRLRGILIHDALNKLYLEKPAHADVAKWDDATISKRASSAVDGAFADHSRHADAVLSALLELEKGRVRRLLRKVIELDLEREPFAIVALEEATDVDIEGIRLHVRVDRVDRLADGELVILDYKTGQERRFLNRDGMPKDMQLVVYACTTGDAISDLGLVNVDSRAISIFGAGKTFSPDLDWHDALETWSEEIRKAAREMAAGDVRLNGLQSRQAARPLALLSRIAELMHDD